MGSTAHIVSSERALSCDPHGIRLPIREIRCQQESERSSPSRTLNDKTDANRGSPSESEEPIEPGAHSSLGSADEHPAAAHPGLRLLPSTVEVIRGELKRQLPFRGEFVDRYFPAVRKRGSVEYIDIEIMTRPQAEALAFSLDRSIRHFEKTARVRRHARQSEESEGELPSVDPYEITSRLFVAALADLRSTFELSRLV